MPRLREFRYDRWAEWILAQVKADRPDVIAVDCETEGLGYHDRAFAGTVTWRSTGGEMRSGYFDLEESARADLMRQTLALVPRWAFHNSKFDLGRLHYIGALPAAEEHMIEDTQPLAALINENRRLALKSLAVTELGIEEVVEVTVKSGPRKGEVKRVPKEQHHLNEVRRKAKLTKDDGFHLLPRDVLIRYAIRDTELTLLLLERLRSTLPADLEDVYAEELEVSRVLLSMESSGVGIDVPYLTEANDEYGALVMVRWQALVRLVGSESFNANSVPQLKAAFQSAGVTLESTDKAHLRDMVANKATPKQAVELAEALRDYRDAEKVYGTYLRPLLAEQRDGIAHPWFNAVGPRTGRTSASKATND